MNEETEAWIPIPNYEGLYEASNLGKIRSVDRVNSRGVFIHGRVLKGTSNGRGYLSLWLSKDGEKKRWLIHRLIAIAFIDNPEQKPEVNHKNGIRNDNRVENLEWVTGSENKLHSYRHLNRKSSFCKLKGKPTTWSRKLTDEQADAIRADSRTCREIAKEYGVSAKTVSNIKRGKFYQTRVV